MLLVQPVEHVLLVDDEPRTKRSDCSIPHAKRLTRQTTLAKEVARPQNCHDRLFATRTKRGNLHAARLYVHHAVGRASLRKDNLCSLELPDFFRHTSRIEKSVSIECVSFLGPSLELFVAALHKTDSMAPRKMKAQSVVFRCHTKAIALPTAGRECRYFFESSPLKWLSTSSRLRGFL